MDYTYAAALIMTPRKYQSSGVLSTHALHIAYIVGELLAPSFFSRILGSALLVGRRDIARFEDPCFRRIIKIKCQ